MLMGIHPAAVDLACFVVTTTAKRPSQKMMLLMTEVLLAPTQLGFYLQVSAYIAHGQQQQVEVVPLGHPVCCVQVRPCISPSCAEKVPLKSSAATPIPSTASWTHCNSSTYAEIS